MTLKDVKHRNPQLGLALEYRGEASKSQSSGAASTATNGHARSGTCHLMEEVVAMSNVQGALKRVVQNKGSAGVDGVAVEEMPQYLVVHWDRIRVELLSGTYQPQPVKRQEIPKRGGGVRELGIPTALDRIIQQAILQVLQPRFDPTFSPHSYGFRPGRRPHDAIYAAQRYITEGRNWVVDVDLEKFFDRVNHDILMSRVADRVEDKRLLLLIRRYLNAGVMAGGVVNERHEGTPQGGPLSPLLANTLLDEVDKELEKRGLAFCRYADDCNVYVRSERAAKDAMDTLRKLFTKLRLKVNEGKSAVARPWDRKFLGFTFHVARGGKVKRAVAPQALTTIKGKIREITKRNCGRKLQAVVEQLRQYLQGWKAYYGVAEVRAPFHEVDAWIRRKLRILQLKQWKRGTTVYKRLRGRGFDSPLAAYIAAHCRKYARVSKLRAVFVALPDKLFDDMGLPRLAR